jgi:hypothetical protein
LSFLLFVRFWRISPRLSRAPHLRTVGLGFCGVVQSRISVVARMFREVNRTSRITYSLHPGFRASLQLCCRLHITTINQDKIERQRVGGTGYHAATCSDSVPYPVFHIPSQFPSPSLTQQHWITTAHNRIQPRLQNRLPTSSHKTKLAGVVGRLKECYISRLIITTTTTHQSIR